MIGYSIIMLAVAVSGIEVQDRSGMRTVCVWSTCTVNTLPARRSMGATTVLSVGLVTEEIVTVSLVPLATAP
jgi:hypothetical protein